MEKKTLAHRLNVLEQCRGYNVGLWSCPQFIFLIMGVVIIGSILVTYNVAQRYTDILIVAMIVILLTIFLFVISFVIVRAFERVVELRRLEIERARQVIELKDQFVFIAAHELRTPATAIKWGLQLLETETGADLSDEGKESITDIRRSSERLLVLVQDILQIARIDGKTISVKLEDVSVPETIETAVKELQSIMTERKVTCNVSLPNNLPLVLADKMRFKEVTSNLLSNAIKYGGENGTVSIKAVRENMNVVISVINGGPGIKPEDQKNVFQKFWRADDAKESGVEGTGLGLFIVKQLVELMHGSIWFTSKPGETTFTFALNCPPANLTERRNVIEAAAAGETEHTAPAAVV